jgi:hypothetical protein
MNDFDYIINVFIPGKMVHTLGSILLGFVEMAKDSDDEELKAAAYVAFTFVKGLVKAEQVALEAMKDEGMSDNPTFPFPFPPGEGGNVN